MDKLIERLEPYALVLASASPRRAGLLAQAGLPFRKAELLQVPEDLPEDLPVGQAAEHLAQRKALAYALMPNDILLTADTTVSLGQRLLDKPADARQARENLELLSGSAHLVRTGICLRHPRRTHAFSETTRVIFRTLRPSEIEHYIQSGAAFDKAGAYGIQDWIGLVGITAIEGCYYNVMGMPIARLWQELASFIDQLESTA